MSFRVTPHRAFELGQMNAQQRYAQTTSLNNDVSSGIRVHKPSDDPSAQKIILNQSAILTRLAAQQDVVQRTSQTVSTANQQLLEAQQLLVKAREIGMQAVGDDEPASKAAFVTELNGILKRLENIANSQSNGEYVFAGAATGTQPFTGVGQGTPAYHAGDTTGSILIAGGLSLKVYYSGRDVFQAPTSGGVAVTGNTGVKGGTGTSTGSQWTALTVRHTSTIFSGTSGVTAGTDSVNGDTIVGAPGVHKLTINDLSGDGSSGTISLNGGEVIHFSSSDTNLKLTGPMGEVAYVNTQNVTAGFNGTIDLTANGTLSIDGGATEVPIDFTSNQMVASSQAGIVRNFDTTQVKRTGTVGVEPSATSDIFQAVIGLRDTILNKNNLSGQELDDAFARRMADLESGSNHLLGIIGEQAVSLQTLDTTSKQMETMTLNAKTTLTDAQGTDYFSAVSQLQEQQMLLQFTLQSLALMNSVSLVDFLN